MLERKREAGALLQSHLMIVCRTQKGKCQRRRKRREDFIRECRNMPTFYLGERKEILFEVCIFPINSLQDCRRLAWHCIVTFCNANSYSMETRLLSYSACFARAPYPILEFFHTVYYHAREFMESNHFKLNERSVL